jgi:3'-5' exonuclease
MPHDRLLCLDIETVPDAELVPADWPADKFIPNPMWHRVVEGCRSGGEASYDEQKLLQAYWGATSPVAKHGW